VSRLLLAGTLAQHAFLPHLEILVELKD